MYCNFLFFSPVSNDGLPVNYTNPAYSGARKKRRLPLTEKKQVLKCGIIDSAKQGTIEVPSEVKKVLMEHCWETELTEEEPDEQMMEVLEDIYVKAGEIGVLFF